MEFSQKMDFLYGADIPSNWSFSYQYVTPDYYKRTQEDEQRRTRRTRAFILLGILVMAALAFGTALVVHYFFVPSSEDRNPGNIVNVSFTANTTEDFPESTTEPTDDEILQLLDVISDGGAHVHDHDHGHILNPDGKIFDDIEPNTSVTDTTTESTTSPGTTTIKTTSTTTTLGSTESEVYELNLIPDTSSSDVAKNAEIRPTKPLDVKTKTTISSKILDSISPKPYTSTMDLNHMDFFGMDDYYGDNLTTTTPYDYDFFGVDHTTPTKKTEPTTLSVTTQRVISSTEVLIKTTSDVANDTTTTTTTTTTDNVKATESTIKSTTTKGGPMPTTTALAEPTTVVNETTTEGFFPETTEDLLSTVASSESTTGNFKTSTTSGLSPEQASSTEAETATQAEVTTTEAKTVETPSEMTPVPSK